MSKVIAIMPAYNAEKTVRSWTIIILILILAMQLALRHSFLGEPLERDEGSYAYIAQRIWHGELPYRDYFDHKPPAVYFIYATIFKLFGDTLESLRIFTLFFSLLTTLAVFLTGNLLWGGIGGLLSAFLYAIFSGLPFIQGTSANTETFMVLPMVLALYCFLRQRWFLAGLLSGLAVMIKPVAAFNFLVLVGFLMIRGSKGLEEKKGKEESEVKKGKFFFRPSALKALIFLKANIPLKALTAIMIGFLVLPLLFAFYFWSQGALSDFFYCNITANLEYLARQPWRISAFISIMMEENSVLWLLAAASIAYIFLKERTFNNLFLAMWGIFSFLGVAQGKVFYGHYFIQVIPALALLSAYAILKIKESKPTFLICTFSTMVFGFLLLTIIGHQKEFFLANPDEISVMKYGFTNFVAAREVAKLIKERTNPSEAIYVWGAEPEIYFYSQRKSASKFISFYPLVTQGRRSQEFRLRTLQDLRRSNPKYIVWVNSPFFYSNIYLRLQKKYRKIASVGNLDLWERK